MTSSKPQNDEDVFRIAIKSRIYHADLLKTAQEFGGIKKFAAHLGISPWILSNWILLRSFPKLEIHRSDGLVRPNFKLAKKWPAISKKLVEATGKTIEELFPDFVKLSGVFEANKGNYPFGSPRLIPVGIARKLFSRKSENN